MQDAHVICQRIWFSNRCPAWRFCIKVPEIKYLQSLPSRGVFVRAPHSGQNDETPSSRLRPLM